MECLEHLIAIAKNAAATATEKLGDGAFDGASSFVEKCTKYYSTALKKVQQNSDFFASELVSHHMAMSSVHLSIYADSSDWSHEEL